MKILLITDCYPTESFKREGIFAYDDFIFLKSQNIDVNLLILNRFTIERMKVSHIFREIKKNVIQIKEIKKTIKSNTKIELINYFSMVKPWVMNEDFLLWKEPIMAKNHYDLVIVHSILHTGLNIKWIRKNFLNSKIILKVHSDWLLFNKIVQKYTLKKAQLYDEIWANSETNKRGIEKLFLSKSIATMKIFVDYPKFHINTERINKKYYPIKFLTVANIIKEKGFDDCFILFEYLTQQNIEWTWEIVGKGNYLEQLNNKIKEYSYTQRIRIIPEVKKENLWQYYQEANFYLQLTYFESFGIAPIEAFCFYNKLIISENIPSITELGIGQSLNILQVNRLKLNERFADIMKFIKGSDILIDFDSNIQTLSQKIYTMPL